MADRIDIPWLVANGFALERQNHDGTRWVLESDNARLVAVPVTGDTFIIGIETADQLCALSFVLRETAAGHGESPIQALTRLNVLANQHTVMAQQHAAMNALREELQLQGGKLDEVGRQLSEGEARVEARMRTLSAIEARVQEKLGQVIEVAEELKRSNPPSVRPGKV